MIKIAQALFTRKKTTRVRAGTNTSQCTLFTILIVFLIVFKWIFFERGEDNLVLPLNPFPRKNFRKIGLLDRLLEIRTIAEVFWSDGIEVGG